MIGAGDLSPPTYHLRTITPQIICASEAEQNLLLKNIYLPVEAVMICEDLRTSNWLPCWRLVAELHCDFV